MNVSSSLIFALDTCLVCVLRLGSRPSQLCNRSLPNLLGYQLSTALIELSRDGRAKDLTA